MLVLCVTLHVMFVGFSELYKIQGSGGEMLCVKTAFVNRTLIFTILSWTTVFHFPRDV
jgi:hypothetical protein